MILEFGTAIKNYWVLVPMFPTEALFDGIDVPFPLIMQTEKCRHIKVVVVLSAWAGGK